MKSLYLLLFFAGLLLSSCSSEVRIPESARVVDKHVQIYPDYTNVVIPPNIAPMNFLIKSVGKEYVVSVEGNTQKVVASGTENGIIQFDEKQWAELLQKSKGQKLTCTIYEKTDNDWIQYAPYFMQVASEPIDSFLSYRLIEPGYELYRQLGLYQRNLSNFTEKVIYENNRSYDDDNNHCVNCHNYQNYHSKNMLFHVRAFHGGTILALNGNIKKLDMKCDSILSSAVYPSWNPKHNWIVFSSNKTGQTFHLFHKEKVEVVDMESDLIFYDADNNVIKNILKTESEMETFPCWSPDGKKIYYCSAAVPMVVGMSSEQKTEWIVSNYNRIRYNVYSMDFNEKTQSFSHPQLEVNCAALKKSASVPRISPDGRFLLFTMGDYGQFHIWHKSSDLYVKDLQTGEMWKLKKANSSDVDSYHSWSSNGRWIVFSTRRDDGNYTRLYMTYFDKSGKDHKAFMLPQKDPTQNLRLLKSYNVPELTIDKVPYSSAQFKDVIYTSQGQAVQYKAK